MARFGKWHLALSVQLVLVAVLTVGHLTRAEHPIELVGSWAGEDGPHGITLLRKGEGALFIVGEKKDLGYGSPLSWSAGRGVLRVRMVDEEGNVGPATEMEYRIHGGELALLSGQLPGVPRRLSKVSQAVGSGKAGRAP